MGSQTKRIQYLYDNRGHRQALIDHDGGRFTYSYDGVGRISVVQNPQGDRTSYAYDPAGRRTLKLLANGTRASFAYDPAGNLTKLYNLKSDGTVISSFDYQYDKVGNRTAVLEADGSRVTWSYDATYQLTGEHRTGTSAYRDTYSYDPTGNRLLKIHDGARTTSAYDAANQLRYTQDASGRTTYTFDADGNQQRILAPNGDRTTYVWDYENRMTSVRLPSGIRNTMAYEPEGLRVKLEESTGVKKFVWDEQNYLAETDSANDTQVVYTNEPRRYGNLVSQRRLTEGVWTPHWYHFDAVGSTREVTDSAQLAGTVQLFDAYGSVVYSSGLLHTSFLYVGEFGYFASGSVSFQYVRGRTYSCHSGTWLSMDPILRTTLYSRYIYSENSPLRFTDPSGLIVYGVCCKCCYECRPRESGGRFIEYNVCDTKDTSGKVNAVACCDLKYPKRKSDEETSTRCIRRGTFYESGVDPVPYSSLYNIACPAKLGWCLNKKPPVGDPPTHPCADERVAYINALRGWNDGTVQEGTLGEICEDYCDCLYAVGLNRWKCYREQCGTI